MVDFVLLGPVGAWTNGAPVDLGHRRQRSVLAVLLAETGRPVPTETLVDRVWGAEPPAAARRTLHSYLTRIRQTLAGLSKVDPKVGEVRRGSGGYVLDVDPGRVDASRFQLLVDRARQPDRTPAERAALLRDALALWRGEPFGGVSGEWAARMRDTWVQRRIDTATAWAELEAEAGNGAATAATLLDLAGEYPLAEPLTAALIRALAAAGRVDEALERHAAIRARLAEELGADPGPELREAQRIVLNGEVRAVSPPVDRPATTRPVPAQLPADVPEFTGREPELARLDAVLGATTVAGAGGSGTAVALLSAVSGTAGVGKSALAARWGHRMADRFPDGQLYLNLRGYDPDRPVAPTDALARILGALDVPGHEIPPDVDDRAARFRTAVAGRRMLLVLDNAATAEQVRPLLPGNRTCAVIVTSRDSLAGLVAVQGAHRIDIGLLRHDEAFSLLRRLVGARVDAEPEAAAALVTQCCRLPLAVRIAAELVSARPTVALSKLVVELRDVQRRLDLLDAGRDPRAAVRSVFFWSVRHLPPPAARAFRLLGVHPGPDFDDYAVAALTGTDHEQASRDLRTLCAAHLVESDPAGRYTMHDLLRAYAAGLGVGAGDAEDRQVAIGRLLDFYLGSASAAMDTLYPGDAYRRPRVAPVRTPAPDLTTADAALAWLDGERRILVEVTAYVAREGRHGDAVRLSQILLRYLASGHHPEAIALHGHARDAARKAGDAAGEGQALLGIAGSYRLTGQHEAATGLLRQAADLFRRAGDRVGQARALGDLGATQLWFGRPEAALTLLEQAKDLFAAVADRCGEARAVSGIGVVLHQQGRYVDAIAPYQRAVDLFRQERDQDGEAQTLTNLGEVARRLGQLDAAARHFERAGDLFRGYGAWSGVAHTLHGLGSVRLALGRHDDAAACLHQALSISRDLGDKHLEAWVLNGIGEICADTGDAVEAIAYYTAARTVATETGERDQQAAAQAGLGEAHLLLGDADQARRHFERALADLVELNPAEADRVRARLEAIDEASPVG